MPTSSSRAEHARKLDRALAELAGERATPDSDPPPRPRSPLRALARVGLRVRPPYYYGLLGAWLYYAVLLVPATGIALWLLVWRYDAARPLGMLSSTLQIGGVLAVAAAVLCRIVARLRRLSRWDAL